MMEIVIKIDEELYNDMKSLPFTILAEDIIINGTPLPKGHGRLIDVDALYDNAKLCHTLKKMGQLVLNGEKSMMHQQ